VVTGKKKKEIDRSRPGRNRFVSPESDDQLMQDNLARELIGVCLQALKTYGLDERKLVDLARAAAGERSPSISSSVRLLSDAEQLANTINRWGEDPRYMDATGRPAVLVTAGRDPSFADLAREFFPKRNVLDVVTLGCKTHVMERVGTDKVARINNAVLFPGNSVLTLAHTVRAVRWLLGTAHHNRQVRAESVLGFPDRSAHVEISADDFAEFVTMIRHQISGLLEMSDRWLFQRSRKPKNRHQKKRLAGIQVFVFRE
jgi:Family of unknown function (DUF6502)